MKRFLIRFLVLVTLSGAFAAAGAVVLYTYGSTRPEIAPGTRVAGVDVGGLDRAAAESKVQTALQPRLEQSVVIEGGSHKFKVSATMVKLAVDVPSLVDEAVQASAGNPVEKGWHHLFGALDPIEIPLTLKADERALERRVLEVAKQLYLAPRAAAVVPDQTATRLLLRKERPGREVDPAELSRTVLREMTSPDGPEAVAVTFRLIQPEVTVASLEERYPVYLLVSKDTLELRLFEKLKLVKTYRVAVGSPEWPTPEGHYQIQNKAVDPAWSVPDSAWAGDLAGQVIPGGSPENPLKARWMGIYDGAGIHGTDNVASLGSAASHGCVRMAVPDVVELYERVPVGTPIFIA